MTLEETTAVLYSSTPVREEWRIDLTLNQDWRTVILLLLEQVFPSGFADEAFVSYESLITQLKVQKEAGTLAMHRNPWVRIEPETWPFSIRMNGGKRVDVEVLPAHGRHDQGRWIRSCDAKEPLAALRIHFREPSLLCISIESHLALSTPASDHLSDRERAENHSMARQRWNHAWRVLYQSPSPVENEQSLALCVLERSLHLTEPGVLPGVPLSVRTEALHALLSTSPGICDRNPLAANALTNIERVLGKRIEK
jgi:hypothetical protein